MTINLSYIDRDFVVCVADRRLSRPTGGIFSERGNKMACVTCADASFVISHNGIGRDLRGETPNDWLTGNPLLPKLLLKDAIESIAKLADHKLAPLRSKYDVRHSFILSGFQLGVPFIALISNYEEVENPACKAVADEQMTCSTSIGHRLFFGAGEPIHKWRPVKARIEQHWKKSDQPAVVLKTLVKAARDVAYKDQLMGTVSPNLQSVILELRNGFKADSHIVGGTTVIEAPAFISPGMMVKDLMADVGGMKDGPAWKGQGHLPEIPCKNCGAPVPTGQLRCGGCGMNIEA